MRIVFMGTPDFSVPVLLELLGQGHEVAAVYTRAPKAAGRGMELRLSPVHAAAQRFGIPVLHPATLRTAEAEAGFAAHGADAAVVVAYGLLLPRAILDAPPLGCLNLHASLLPRWRGAAPIQRAIMAGDSLTGVMAMRMEEGLDTGPVGMAEEEAITPAMTGGELHGALARIGADLMARALAALGRGSLQFKQQAAFGATYAKKIEKADCRIDFGQDAQTVHNHIRALSPFPGAFFEADFGKGVERLKVLRAELADAAGPGVVRCGSAAVRLLSVQRAGKGVVTMAEFLRGATWPAALA